MGIGKYLSPALILCQMQCPIIFSYAWMSSIHVRGESLVQKVLSQPLAVLTVIGSEKGVEGGAQPLLRISWLALKPTDGAL